MSVGIALAEGSAGERPRIKWKFLLDPSYLLPGIARLCWSILPSAVSILVFAGCSIHSVHTHDDRCEVDPELIVQSTATNRMLSSREMSRELPNAEAVVNDPVYAKQMRYEGFWLEDVLKPGQ